MVELITHFGSYIGGALLAIVAVFGIYFKGKSTGKTEEQTKNTIDNAQKEVAATEAATAHETQVVNEVKDAKQQTSDLSDADLRKRMRDNYTDK